MRTPGANKKVDKENSEESKTQGVVEPPKSLLSDKPAENETKTEAEVKKEPVAKDASAVEKASDKAVRVEAKDEAKKEDKVDESAVREPTEVLPSIDVKTEEVKNETKKETAVGETATVSMQSGSAPPPISIPISTSDTSYSSEKPSSKPLLWILFAIAVIILVAAGGWFYLSKTAKPDEKMTEEKAVTEPVKEAGSSTGEAATEEAKLDAYEIKVLNGSGSAGEASKAQTALEAGGFKVSSTGNAETYDYTDTIVLAKESVEKSFIRELKTLLSKSYSVGKDATLAASDSSDVAVIVGSKKVE